MKELNEYSNMLLSGEFDSKYILGKIDVWTKAINGTAFHADKQIKQEQCKVIK